MLHFVIAVDEVYYGKCQDLIGSILRHTQTLDKSIKVLCMGFTPLNVLEGVETASCELSDLKTKS